MVKTMPIKAVTTPVLNDTPSLIPFSMFFTDCFISAKSVTVWICAEQKPWFFRRSSPLQLSIFFLRRLLGKLLGDLLLDLVDLRLDDLRLHHQLPILLIQFVHYSSYALSDAWLLDITVDIKFTGLLMASSFACASASWEAKKLI